MSTSKDYVTGRHLHFLHALPLQLLNYVTTLYILAKQLNNKTNQNSNIL